MNPFDLKIGDGLRYHGAKRVFINSGVGKEVPWLVPQMWAKVVAIEADGQVRYENTYGVQGVISGGNFLTGSTAEEWKKE